MGEVGRELVTVLFLVICSDKSLAGATVNASVCVGEREGEAKASVNGHKQTPAEKACILQQYFAFKEHQSVKRKVT